MGVSDDECPNGLNCGQERPEHQATVAPFRLDKYEVTVGRFREFVKQYDGTPPVDEAGAHPLIPGSGWQSAWNSELPNDKAALEAALAVNSTSRTWTQTSTGGHEQAAINYVTWFEAMAFCIWDGGTLPTEAQWEYAAAGGSEDRIYPWGNDAPSATNANYADTDNDPFLRVGSKPAGAGKWGHQNLADGLREWTIDWYDGGWYHDDQGDPKTCDNCANLGPNDSTMTVRALRGGSWSLGAEELRSANRSFDGPAGRSKRGGIRCVRF